MAEEECDVGTAWCVVHDNDENMNCSIAQRGQSDDGNREVWRSLWWLFFNAGARGEGLSTLAGTESVVLFTVSDLSA